MEGIKISLKIIYYLVLAITLVYSLYFSLVGIYGLIKKRKTELPKENKVNRFAILIAARNESMVIGNLIDSLKKLDYPKDSYKIYVIPNNCKDNTEEISIKHGADILKCEVKTKTKADVLRYAFDKLRNEKIDAYVIFDADNIADKYFLKEMNKVLNTGYNVAQGLREAKNPSDSWVSGSYAIYYMLSNLFINLSRNNNNISCSINGTGFMVSKKLIDEKGFNTKSLTEDIEFSSICALNNEKIYFAKKAITYDEHPESFKVSMKQRKRWSTGTIQCMNMYSKKLLKNFLKTGSIASLDMYFVFIAPVIQILSFLNILFIPVFRLLKIDLLGFDLHMLITGIVSSIVSYIITILFIIIVVITQKKKVIPLLKGILLFPLFIFTWIPIHIHCFLKKEDEWEEIKHTKNIKIEEISKGE